MIRFLAVTAVTAVLALGGIASGAATGMPGWVQLLITVAAGWAVLCILYIAHRATPEGRDPLHPINHNEIR